MKSFRAIHIVHISDDKPPTIENVIVVEVVATNKGVMGVYYRISENKTIIDSPMDSDYIFRFKFVGWWIS